MNLIKAITMEAKSAPLTPIEQSLLERWTRPIVHPFEDLARAFRYHLRQKKGLTGLSQTEWENLTDAEAIKSVVENRPLPLVGELLKKASAFERGEFYSIISGKDKEVHKAAREARAATKKAKKATKKV